MAADPYFCCTECCYPCCEQPNLTFQLAPISIGAIKFDFNTVDFSFTNFQHLSGGFPLAFITPTPTDNYRMALTQNAFIQFGINLLDPARIVVSETGLGTGSAVFYVSLPPGTVPLYAGDQYPTTIASTPGLGVSPYSPTSSKIPRAVAKGGKIAFLATRNAGTELILMVADYRSGTVESSDIVAGVSVGVFNANVRRPVGGLNFSSRIYSTVSGGFAFTMQAFLIYSKGGSGEFGKAAWGNTIAAGGTQTFRSKEYRLNNTLVIIFMSLSDQENTLDCNMASSMIAIAGLDILAEPYSGFSFAPPLPGTVNAYSSPERYNCYPGDTGTAANVAPIGAVLASYADGAFFSTKYGLDIIQCGVIPPTVEDKCACGFRDLAFGESIRGTDPGKPIFDPDSGAIISNYANGNITGFYSQSSGGLLSFAATFPIEARTDPGTLRQITFLGGTEPGTVAGDIDDNNHIFGGTYGFVRNYAYIEPDPNNPDIAIITQSTVLWALSDGSRRDVLDVRNYLKVI